MSRLVGCVPRARCAQRRDRDVQDCDGRRQLRPDSAKPAVHYVDSTVLRTRIVILGSASCSAQSIFGPRPVSTRASVFNEDDTLLFGFDAAEGAEWRIWPLQRVRAVVRPRRQTRLLLKKHRRALIDIDRSSIETSQAPFTISYSGISLWPRSDELASGSRIRLRQLFAYIRSSRTASAPGTSGS
jgi:hypothetical protein